MHRFKGIVLPLLLAAVIWTTPAAGQSTEDIHRMIRQEGLENSQVMDHLQVLTDYFGARLTGSPTLEASGEWALNRMESWGLQNARKDEWDWGRPGWENVRFSAHMVSPANDALIGEVLAWTPGTDGPVRAEAVQVAVPERPTDEVLAAHLDGLRGSLTGKIILLGDGTPAPTREMARRHDDEEIAERFQPGVADATPARPYSAPTGPENALSAREVRSRIDEFLISEGAAVVITPSRMEHGLIRAFANYTFDLERSLPSVVMRTEDYQRISRLLANDVAVELEIDIRNNVYPERTTEYNYTIDIPGTDLAHEVIYLGGHIDSWHSATGATDNASGVSVMMEAVRILQELGLQPRRTIRVAFWTGEEQGLLGSQAYVAKHYGTFEEPTQNYQNFGGYLNLDSGTGRIRGLSVFGPVETAQVLHEIVQPFADLGVVGARETASRRLGGSDHTAFNRAGLPGISLGQDPIDYFTTTWHTNRDTYDHILPDDMKQAAVVSAAVAFELATRDELLPRFAPDAMPEGP